MAANPYLDVLNHEIANREQTIGELLESAKRLVSRKQKPLARKFRQRAVALSEEVRAFKASRDLELEARP